MRSVGCYAKNLLHKLLALCGSVSICSSPLLLFSSSLLLLFRSSPLLLLSSSPLLLFSLSLLFLLLFLFVLSFFFFLAFLLLLLFLLFSSALFSYASLSRVQLAYQTPLGHLSMAGVLAAGNWLGLDHPPILTFASAPHCNMFDRYIEPTVIGGINQVC